MNRLRTRFVTMSITLGAGLAPVLAALYFSWAAAVEGEQQRLNAAAQRAIARADRLLNTAQALLAELDGYQGGRCTPEHVALMQAADARTPGLRNIAVIARESIACFAWGGAASRPLPQPDARTIDRIALWYGASFPGAPDGIVAVRSAEHIALVNSQHIVSAVDAEAGTTFVVATREGHHALAVNGGLPAESVMSLATRRTGLAAPTTFVASAASSRWPFQVFVASQPGAAALGKAWLREAQALLPLGAIGGALTATLALFLTRRRWSPVSKLRRALRRREFVLRYQPVIKLATGACVGAEALVRWHHPDRGMVAPDRFIPLAEQAGLIRPMTETILATVLAETGTILRARRDLHVAVNLASTDFGDHGIADLFARALAGKDIAPHQIGIETTEHGMLDHASAREVIATLRARGHRIAIDDFGTGYSNLASLQSMAVDVLKIDKLFIDAIDQQDGQGRNDNRGGGGSVIPHIVEMARALRLRTVAEGVETAAQVRYLRKQSVDYAQGWYFSKPLTAEAFRDFLRRSPQRCADAVSVLPS